jgi:hypothetical protein
MGESKKVEDGAFGDIMLKIRDIFESMDRGKSLSGFSIRFCRLMVVPEHPISPHPAPLETFLSDLSGLAIRKHSPVGS